MKPIRIAIICLSLSLLGAVFTIAAFGQDARLRIDLGHLEAKAAQVTDVTVDERMLKLGTTLLSHHHSADVAKAQELLKHLKGVYVKAFEFDHEGEYSLADLDGVRSQLRSPDWLRIVNVHSKREGLNVEVYILGDADKVQGLAVIAAEPRELVVVNVVGPIDLEKIGELEGNFGIPDWGLKLDLGHK